MRRRKIKGALEKYLGYTDYIITGENDSEIAKEVFDFASSYDLEIELGSGCTGFLITHAERNPNKRYLAIEFKEELLLKAAKKIEELGLKNIKLLRYRIENLQETFEKLSTSKIYLNFSDPWPKARHAKRRLTHSNYLDLYKKILVNNGQIEFKTDDLPMFEFSVEEFSENGFKILEISRDLHSEKNDVVMSEYEKKFSSFGQKINYVKVQYEK